MGKGGMMGRGLNRGGSQMMTLQHADPLQYLRRGSQQDASFLSSILFMRIESSDLSVYRNMVGSTLFSLFSFF